MVKVTDLLASNGENLKIYIYIFIFFILLLPKNIYAYKSLKEGAKSRIMYKPPPQKKKK